MKFDLILMDVHMPVMDGLEATQKLRKQGCKVPIVALTANAMKKNIDECMEVGFDEIMSKPVDRYKFFEMVSKRLSEARNTHSN